MSTWYEQSIFYHMYPLGMVGADKINNKQETEHNFKELNQWVLHVKRLGCTSIYIGPLFESGSHGYDTRDFKQVDRRLGDNRDFKEFVGLCHEAGIKVVVDGVFNHTGREFFAFKNILKQRENSSYKDWYKGVNFYGNSPMGDSFSYESWQGHAMLPALNLQNHQVKHYLFDVIRFWIEEFDIDGIRLDCANVLDFQFIKEMREITDAAKADFWLMGEVIHGDYNRWVNQEMLHSVTNYDLHKGLYSGHNDHNYFEIAHTVKRQSEMNGGIFRDIQLYTFVDNHDENRIASKLTDKRHLFPVYTLLFTLPGIPSVYYGSEWGIEGTRTNYSDDDLRPAIDIATADKLHCPLTDYIGILARIHKENPAFHHGTYKELFLSNRQFAFARLVEGSTVVVAVNNDENECDLRIPLPVSAKAYTNLITGEKVIPKDNHLEIHLEGNKGVLIKLEER